MAVHINGLGESLGDSLVISPGGPIYQDIRQAWYVNSVTGSDSYDGRSSKMPLATLSQAQTNATAGDIVVLMSGHAETFTSTLTISKTLVIVGGGSSSGLPTVKLTNNQNDSVMFTISGNYVELRNVWIEEESHASGNNVAGIDVTGTGTRIRGCYFQLDGKSADGAGLRLSMATGEFCDVTSTTFISTASAASSVPGTGIENAGDGILRMDGVVFDGGTVGFLKGYGFSESNSSTGLDFLAADNISLLRGADMNVHDSTLGFVQVSTDSDEPRIDWTDTGPA